MQSYTFVAYVTENLFKDDIVCGGFVCCVNKQEVRLEMIWFALGNGLSYLLV